MPPPFPYIIYGTEVSNSIFRNLFDRADNQLKHHYSLQVVKYLEYQFELKLFLYTCEIIYV